MKFEKKVNENTFNPKSLVIFILISGCFIFFMSIILTSFGGINRPVKVLLERDWSKPKNEIKIEKQNLIIEGARFAVFQPKSNWDNLLLKCSPYNNEYFDPFMFLCFIIVCLSLYVMLKDSTPQKIFTQRLINGFWKLNIVFAGLYALKAIQIIFFRYYLQKRLGDGLFISIESSSINQHYYIAFLMLMIFFALLIKKGLELQQEQDLTV